MESMVRPNPTYGPIVNRSTGRAIWEVVYELLEGVEKIVLTAEHSDLALHLSPVMDSPWPHDNTVIWLVQESLDLMDLEGADPADGLLNPAEFTESQLWGPVYKLLTVNYREKLESAHYERNLLQPADEACCLSGDQTIMWLVRESLSSRMRHID